MISFPLFLTIWNRGQGLSTPDVHYRIAHWLEQAWKNDDRYLLLMAFRSCGKSTIVGLFCAWLLFTDPNLRILVLAADLNLARKMVRNVKKIIERHMLTQHLLPEKKEQWASDRFTIKRDQEKRDPSMQAKGITANITGSRAEVVICDDVEVPKTCDTAEKRADLREKLLEIDYVLVQGGTRLYVGTPHHYYSIYADAPRKEIGEDVPFLQDFKRLLCPIITPEGAPAWPERYTIADIDRIKTHTGPNKFQSQMMLQPVSINEGRLNPEDLTVYDEELTYKQAAGRAQLWLGGTRLVSSSAFWDPAFAAAQGKGDSSVLAVVFSDDAGRYYLHRCAYIKSEAGSSEDEATQQCRQVVKIAAALMLPSITIEINGLGRFLPNILRRELAAAGVSTSVIELSNRRPKAVRIIEAFDAVMAARALYVHDSVIKTPFIREMQEWRPEKTSAHDDGLDAAAGALAAEPVRIRALTHSRSHRPAWQGSGGQHMADSDFSV
tara:strand:- start:457006 stop:458487 length:1482 start_codon:yes stop_codon:yes gene_type:complete